MTRHTPATERPAWTTRAALLPVALCLMLAAPSVTAEPPAPSVREIDFIPPQWTTFTIRWKPTWDETVSANTDANWRKELAGNNALRHAANSIVSLRRVELLKAMIQRFAAEKKHHAEAYLAIARAYRQIGLNQHGAYYGWKVIKEFPDRADLAAEAYLMMVSQPVGIHFPHCRAWAFAFYDAMSLTEKGVIPPKHPAARLACRGVKNLICDEMRYDAFGPILDRFKRLGAKDPQINEVAMGLLRFFGDGHRAKTLAPKGPAPVWWAAGVPEQIEPGSIVGMLQDRELEVRLAALEAVGKLVGEHKPVSVEDVQKLLDDTVDTAGYARRNRSHYISYRTLVEQALGRLSPQRLASLRTAHEQAARFRAGEALSESDWNEMVALLRRYPYARSVHESLVAFGERLLRQGYHAQAARAFRDAAALTDDDTLRVTAQTGLWLAMIGGGRDRPELRRAMAGVPDTASLPWRGGHISAARLKKKLLDQIAVESDSARQDLTDAPPVRLELPLTWPGRQAHAEGPGGDYGLHAPWPVIRIQQTRGGLILTGPGSIARFSSDGGKPVWMRSSDQIPQPWPKRRSAAYARNAWQHGRFHRRPTSVSAHWSSAVAGNGRVIAHLTGWPPAVAALDARTGKQLWSTRGAAWAKLVPMTRPAAAYGRIYVLALPGRCDPQGRIESSGPWQLVCLTARDGQILWQQSIGWPARMRLDVARYGCAVTLARGAVFCSTNAGLLARCDATDGRVTWVRGYPGMIRNASQPHSPVYRREGAGPLVVGSRMLVAPRDHSGVMAVAADSGRLLWEAIMVPSDRVLGVSGKTVVVAGDRWLAALSVETGKVTWTREFPDGTGSQGAVVGPEVRIVTGDVLHRISAAEGKTIEQVALRDTGDADPSFLPDGRLLSIAAPPLSDAGQPAVKTAGLALPLVRGRFVACENARLGHSADSPGAAEGVCLISGRRLAYFRTQPSLQLLWQRTLAQAPYRAKEAGGHLLLTTRRRLTSLNLADGRRRWSLELAFQPHAIGGDGRLVLALPGLSGSAQIAAIDPQAGKVLWTRSLAGGARFRGGIARVELRRTGSDPRTLKVVLSTLFANVGWRPGTVVLDRRTGGVQSISPYAPPADPGRVTFTGTAVRYGGSDPRVRVVPAGTTVPGGRTYALPKVDRPGVQTVLAFRKTPRGMIVVSGVTGRAPAAIGEGAAPYDARNSRIYVDVFNPATGKHAGRQVLDGVAFSTTALTGYQTQVKILDRAIVVTDRTGAHLFVNGKPTG